MFFALSGYFNKVSRRKHEDLRGMGKLGRIGRLVHCRSNSDRQFRTLALKFRRMGGSRKPLFSLHLDRTGRDVSLWFSGHEDRLHQVDEFKIKTLRRISPRGSGAFGEDRVRDAIQV